MKGATDMADNKKSLSNFDEMLIGLAVAAAIMGVVRLIYAAFELASP